MGGGITRQILLKVWSHNIGAPVDVVPDILNWTVGLTLDRFLHRCGLWSSDHRFYFMDDILSSEHRFYCRGGGFMKLILLLVSRETFVCRYKMTGFTLGMMVESLNICSATIVVRLYCKDTRFNWSAYMDDLTKTVSAVGIVYCMGGLLKIVSRRMGVFMTRTCSIWVM